MPSPTPPPVDSPDPQGEGLLERLGAQLASLTAQVSEIDERMHSVESGSPSRPVEVELSTDTIAQIAEALVALQAAGNQALDDVFKSATDDLTEALSGLVRAEISRSLSDAGYSVDVIEAAESDAAAVVEDLVAEEDLAEQDLSNVEPMAASVRSGPEPAAVPTMVAPLAASAVGAADRTETAPDSIESGSIREANAGFGDSDADDEDEDVDVDTDRSPLALAELDDPFLDALIRKEPLSA